jgi:molybdenum-dependent DNA-binding transcriptional regulator ModE
LNAAGEARYSIAQAIRMAGSVLRASRMTVCFSRRAWQALPIAARLKGVAPSLHEMRGKKKETIHMLA